MQIAGWFSPGKRHTVRISYTVFLCALLLEMVPTSLHAQAYTESVIYAPSPSTGRINPYTQLIQASDGNFYGVAEVSTPAYGTADIFKVSPSGVGTVLYTFPNSDASQIRVTEGSDGNLYGALTLGGTNYSSGAIFQLTPSGTYTALYNFLEGENPYGLLIQGSDGNFYGTTLSGGKYSQGTIFKLTSSGNLTTLYSFCSQAGCADGSAPRGGLVQGSDGNFYGTTYLGGIQCPISDEYAPGCGTVFKITPTGAYSVVYSFTGGSDGAFPESTLVEGSNGSFYGTTSYTNNPNDLSYGVVFDLTPSGRLTPLYNLSPYAGNTYPLQTDLILGSDGNFYGADYYGGPYSAGSVYQIVPSGVVNQIYGFVSSSAELPDAPLTQGADGNFYGPTWVGGAINPGAGVISGTVYELAVSPPLPPPVALTLSQQSIQANQTVTLNWSVANAYSTTMQQCYAFIQGSPTDAGTWSGLQTGTFDATRNPPYSGSATITPTADGVYTYALTCGGMESGFVTLIVGTPPALTVTTTSLPAGQAGMAYAQNLQATGGVPPYTWSVSSGALSAGLLLASTSGAISGTPTAPGTARFTIQVKDAESTPQSATQNLTITVNPAPLGVGTASLPGGTEGVAYSQTLQATGGIAPYSWSITNGTLPAGLSLSSSSGTISGTPTSLATFVFTVQVKDSESTPQTATASLNIVVSASALAVTTSNLPGATVGAAYSQTLDASGGVAPYTWSVISGALPAGLSLAPSTGAISGAPTAAGTASFTVQVMDSESTPQSASANLSITINLSQAATPTFSPAAGTYTSGQTVTIGDATSGMTIYYTTNGATPTTSSTVYSGPITVSSTETIEAIAAGSGYTNSAVGSAMYTINIPVAATPAFSPMAGTYTSPQNVTISDATNGVTIYYTINATTPTTSSTVYSGPITVSSTETIEAIAAGSGYTNSAVGSAMYTINIPVAAAPTFSPAAGTYTSPQNVTISDPTASATIYYTTNGTTPTTSSTKYTSPVTVSSTETIEAMAVASGFTHSSVASATYTISVPSFALSASPANVSVAQGGSGTSTITVTAVGGFAGVVSPAASGLPSGVTASFAVGSEPGTQVLTLTASSSASVTSSPVTVTVTGTSGTLTASTSIALTITAEPSFTAGGGSTSITVTSGATTGNTDTISVVGTNGFSGTVDLSCDVTTSMTGVKDMPMCSLNPTAVTISGAAAQASTLTVNTTASSSAQNRIQRLFGQMTGGTFLALITLFLIPKRQRSLIALPWLFVLLVFAGAIGCGGGGNGGGGGGGGGGTSGTTPGGYTITITGTSGTTTVTVGTISLTVQ